ncbi:MAG TPA: ribosome maturation factor RimM [Burkholderiaceae bacterium]|nr:ribosome maturation factor RimM [Burkholderiaceae bacterium]
MTESKASTAQAVPQDLVELGRVSGAYGVRGWIKIQPHAAGSAALLKSRTWWLRRSLAPAQTGELPAPWPVKVGKSRTQGSTIVGSLEGVSDRTDAEKLRGCTVWVSRSQFPAVEDDEYYWVDLIGCTLFGEHEGNRVLLGVVDGVLDNGAHAVLRVTRQYLDEQGVAQAVLDTKGRPLEILVPFVAAHVHTVDLENRRLESDWPADY